MTSNTSVHWDGKFNDAAADELTFANYLMLFRPLCTFTFHAVALLFFALTFYRMIRNESEFGDASRLQKGFLILWVMESFSAIPTSFYASIMWPRIAWASDGECIQWVSVGAMSLLACCWLDKRSKLTPQRAVFLSQSALRTTFVSVGPERLHFGLSVWEIRL